MRILFLACLSAAACSDAAPSQRVAGSEAGAAHERVIPEGARVQASGFYTVEQAPDSPAEPRKPRGPKNEQTFYAELAGVSNEEAAKRLKEQEALRPQMERLLEQLRTRERGNYTDAELIHRPDWAFLLFFKRDPDATLAKYTKNPRFQARHARYTEQELQKLAQPWIDRFTPERLFTGYGMNARQGRAEIDMIVGEEEYAAIAARNGWEALPDYIHLRFDAAPVGDAVDPRVAQGIRIFAQSDRNLGIIHQAAFGGRIVLRDGCLFVIGHDGKEQLAYFGREVGLGLDPQGYLALHSRTAEPRHLGRIGERFTWAGPIGIGEDASMVTELRARCGTAPLMHVGIPESSAIFNARYGLPTVPVPPPPPHPPPPEEPDKGR